MEPVRDLSRAVSPRRLVKRVPLYLGAVRFHESIFALPFAYSGMVLAADGLPSWSQFVWITVAMVSARTLGMSSNRIIDRHIDALNPRTAERHLPGGLLGLRDMMVLAVVALGIFFLASSQLNLLALALAPVAAVYLIVYPLTKRFTWTASLALGGALGMAPSAAWIGVRGSLSWEPVLLSAAVALWAGSFDILYHVQDREFYFSHGLHSVVRRFGVNVSFRWAQTFDAAAVICLVGLGLAMGLALPYFIGCVLTTGLLFYKYRVVSPDDITRMGMAFLRINAYVSTTMFISTLIAVLVG